MQNVICASFSLDVTTTNPHCSNTLTSHKFTRALAVGPGS
jgi:hypothetical protein